MRQRYTSVAPLYDVVSAEWPVYRVGRRLGVPLLHLRPGDVIPVQLPELVTVYAEDVPVFRGRYGQSNGRNAIRYQAPAGRRERVHGADHSHEKNPA